MKRLFVVLVVLLTAQASIAAPFFADIQVNADTEVVQGTTNYENFSSSINKTVDNGVVTFRLHTNTVFTDYIYDVKMPRTAEITYINSSARVRIITEDDHAVIRGIGSDEPIQITVQYVERNQAAPWWSWIIVVAVLVSVAAVLILYATKSEKAIPKDLTKRQRKIYAYLLHIREPVTQQRIAEELHIPKSSVSRNISSLEKKGYVERVEQGNSKKVQLCEGDVQPRFEWLKS